MSINTSKEENFDYEDVEEGEPSECRKIIQEMFKVIFLYNQILKKIHNILLRNNFIHKVYNLKFQYKILIKEEGDPRLMDLFDLRIYLFLAKANNKDKIQSYSRQVVIIQCQLMLWKLRK